MAKTIYCVGFAINSVDIMLIKKNRPKWQKDKLNGIGGKVGDTIPGETPVAAMVREFEEEAGLITNEDEWCYFGVVDNVNYELHIFYTELTRYMYDNYQNCTDEQIHIKYLDNLFENFNTVKNLKWIIPLIQDTSILKSIKFFDTGIN